MSAEQVDLDSILSGNSGVQGRRSQLRGRLRDRVDSLAFAAGSLPRQLRTAAASSPRRKVRVLGVYGNASAATMRSAVDRLRTSRHELQLLLGSLDASSPALEAETKLDHMRGAGKFQNLNALIEQSNGEVDWTLVVDDDVALPRHFLDWFVFCIERFEFDLAQPALTHASHAAWPVFRRRRGAIARRTRMVEIGPVTAFGSKVASDLLPFPDLQMGWGLDAYWGGLALERGWRLGVVDATPVRHESRVTGASYDRAAAESEARAFLAGKPHIDRNLAQQVAETYRRLDAIS